MQDYSKKSDELNQSFAVIEICKDLLEHKKRDTRILFVSLIISLCMNFAIVGAFLWYESGWEYPDTVTTTTEQVVDRDSGSTINGDQYNDDSQNKSGGDK